MTSDSLSNKPHEHMWETVVEQVQSQRTKLQEKAGMFYKHGRAYLKARQCSTCGKKVYVNMKVED